MDLSFVLSAISIFIACCALAISYRSYLAGKSRRRSDRLMEIRIQVLELKSRALITRAKLSRLIKDHPEGDDETLIPFDDVIKKIESIHNKLYKDPTHLSEKELDNLSIDVQDVMLTLDGMDMKLPKRPNQGS